MDQFVEQLASLCRAHVSRSKWVFVPSHALGRTIGERIALEGTNWLNLRFVTPLRHRAADGADDAIVGVLQEPERSARRPAAANALINRCDET